MQHDEEDDDDDKDNNNNDDDDTEEQMVSGERTINAVNKTTRGLPCPFAPRRSAEKRGDDDG